MSPSRFPHNRADGSTMWPPPADLHAAWEKLIEDPTTAAEFAELVLPPLIATLTAQHRGVDPHAVATAAEDAVLELLRDPRRFDPTRRGLRGYLVMAADRDFANLCKAEGCHNRRRNPEDVVELDLSTRNDEVDDDPPSFDAPGFRTVIAGFTPQERAAFELMRGGERSTSAFADALGVANRPADEQEAEVKRVKDRIKARFKRAREASHDD